MSLDSIEEPCMLEDTILKSWYRAVEIIIEHPEGIYLKDLIDILAPGLTGEKRRNFSTRVSHILNRHKKYGYYKTLYKYKLRNCGNLYIPIVSEPPPLVDAVFEWEDGKPTEYVFKKYHNGKLIREGKEW